MLEFLQNPFSRGLFTGLAIGLLAVLWTVTKNWWTHRERRKEMEARLAAVNAEVEKLRQHLHTQMEITAKGNEDQKKELDELRTRNENLRILVQTLQQKPEPARARQLEVWQRALDRMQAGAPGFAAAWQSAVQEAENEVAESEGGLTRFVKKFLGTGKPGPATAPAALPEPPAKESSDV
jgi:TolA-binding protein